MTFETSITICVIILPDPVVVVMVALFPEEVVIEKLAD